MARRADYSYNKLLGEIIAAKKQMQESEEYKNAGYWKQQEANRRYNNLYQRVGKAETDLQQYQKNINEYNDEKERVEQARREREERRGSLGGILQNLGHDALKSSYEHTVGDTAKLTALLAQTVGAKDTARDIAEWALNRSEDMQTAFGRNAEWTTKENSWAPDSWGSALDSATSTALDVGVLLASPLNYAAQTALGGIAGKGAAAVVGKTNKVMDAYNKIDKAVGLAAKSKSVFDFGKTALLNPGQSARALGGGLVGALPTAVGMSLPELYGDQLEFDENGNVQLPNSVIPTYLLALPHGLIEHFGIDPRKPFSNTAKKSLKKFVEDWFMEMPKRALGEGTEEFLQDGIALLNKRLSEDVTSPVQALSLWTGDLYNKFPELLQSFILGGIGGAIIPEGIGNIKSNKQISAQKAAIDRQLADLYKLTDDAKLTQTDTDRENLKNDIYRAIEGYDVRILDSKTSIAEKQQLAKEKQTEAEQARAVEQKQQQEVVDRINDYVSNLDNYNLKNAENEARSRFFSNPFVDSNDYDYANLADIANLQQQQQQQEKQEQEPKEQGEKQSPREQQLAEQWFLLDEDAQAEYNNDINEFIAANLEEQQEEETQQQQEKEQEQQPKADKETAESRENNDKYRKIDAIADNLAKQTTEKYHKEQETIQKYRDNYMRGKLGKDIKATTRDVANFDLSSKNDNNIIGFADKQKDENAIKIGKYEEKELYKEKNKKLAELYEKRKRIDTSLRKQQNAILSTPLKQRAEYIKSNADFIKNLQKEKADINRQIEAEQRKQAANKEEIGKKYEKEYLPEDIKNAVFAARAKAEAITKALGLGSNNNSVEDEKSDIANEEVAEQQNREEKFFRNKSLKEEYEYDISHDPKLKNMSYKEWLDDLIDKVSKWTLSDKKTKYLNRLKREKSYVENQKKKAQQATNEESSAAQKDNNEAEKTAKEDSNKKFFDNHIHITGVQKQQETKPIEEKSKKNETESKEDDAKLFAKQKTEKELKNEDTGVYLNGKIIDRNKQREYEQKKNYRETVNEYDYRVKKGDAEVSGRSFEEWLGYRKRESERQGNENSSYAKALDYYNKNVKQQQTTSNKVEDNSPIIADSKNINYKDAVDKLSKKVGVLLTEAKNNTWLCDVLFGKKVMLDENRLRKLAQELFEGALCKYIRDNKPSLEQVLTIYKNQPTLNNRTQSQKDFQAYSTPVALAKALTDILGIKDGDTVLEPTAGNGLLLSSITKGANFILNELQDDRANILKGIFGDKVTQNNALTMDMPSSDFVVTNPPFGRNSEIPSADVSMPKLKANGTVNYKLTDQAHIIAANALKAMKADGKAVIIYGAPNGVFGKEGDVRKGGALRFETVLFNYYNVVGLFEVGGNLYSKQGTSFPIACIVIDGKRDTNHEYFNSNKAKVKRLTAWEDVFKECDNIKQRMAEGKDVLGNDVTRLTQKQTATEKDNKYKKLADLLQKAGYKEKDNITRAELSKLSKQAGFKLVNEILAEVGETPFVNIGRIPINSKFKDGSTKYDQNKFFISRYSGLNEEELRNEQKEYDNKQKAKEESEEQTRLKEKYPVLNDIDTNEKLWKALDNVKSRELQDILLSENTKRFEEAQKTEDGKKKWNKEREAYERSKTGKPQQKKETTITKEVKEQAKEKAKKEAEKSPEQLNEELAEGVKEAEAQAVEEKNTENKTESTNDKVAGDGRLQVSYNPVSQSNSIGALVPTNLAKAINTALKIAQETYGNLTDFVAKMVGKTRKQTQDAFAAEQIDVLSLYADKLINGSAMVCADQTGLGKGRVAAGAIQMSKKAGHIPMFCTEMDTLFSDIYRDMRDTGGEKLRPFFVNANGEMTYVANGEIKTAYRKISDTERKRVLNNLHNGNLSDFIGENAKYDYIVSTYSQFKDKSSSSTFKTESIEKLLSNGEIDMILDEAHNIASEPKLDRNGKEIKPKDGDEEGQRTYRRFLKFTEKANSILFLSATWAKRKGNMSIYNRAIGLDTEEINKQLTRGQGMIELLVMRMAMNGRYIRREQSFEGVTYTGEIVTKDEEDIKNEVKLSDEHNEIILDTIQLSMDIGDLAKDEEFVRPFAVAKYGENASLAKQKGKGKELNSDKGNTTPFNTLHNYIGNMLLSIKADRVADEAIKQIKAGLKPVIALEKTGGASVDRFANTEHLSYGQKIKPMTMLDVFRGMMLDQLNNIPIETTTGEKGLKIDIPFDALPEGIKEQYREIFEKLQKTSLNELPGSPIDRIEYRIRKAGYTVEDITGRNSKIDYVNDNEATFESIGKKDSKVIVNDFNSGNLDCVILNVKGATGISMHASDKFKDKRQRIMLIAQPFGDPNKMMQMLGRIHRVGQVSKPIYKYVMTSLLQEIRQSVNLQDKLKSLNANTSSNKEGQQKFSDVDINNIYGQEACRQWIEKNIAIALQIGLANYDKEGTKVEVRPFDVKKVTGRINVTSQAVQNEFWDFVLDKTKELIAEADARGDNQLNIPSYADTDAIVLDSRKIAGETKADDYYIKSLDIQINGNPATLENAEARAKEGYSIADNKTAMEELQNKCAEYVNHTDDRIKNKKNIDINKIKENVKSSHRDLMIFLNNAKVGEKVINEIGDEGVITKIVVKPTKDVKTGNPLTDSKIVITMASPTKTGTTTMTLSSFRRNNWRFINEYAEGEYFSNKWEEAYKQNSTHRQKVEAITGNLLNALDFAVQNNMRVSQMQFRSKDGNGKMQFVYFANKIYQPMTKLKEVTEKDFAKKNYFGGDYDAYGSFNIHLWDTGAATIDYRIGRKNEKTNEFIRKTEEYLGKDSWRNNTVYIRDNAVEKVNRFIKEIKEDLGVEFEQAFTKEELEEKLKESASFKNNLPQEFEEDDVHFSISPLLVDKYANAIGSMPEFMQNEIKDTLVSYADKVKFLKKYPNLKSLVDGIDENLSNADYEIEESANYNSDSDEAKHHRANYLKASEKADSLAKELLNEVAKLNDLEAIRIAKSIAKEALNNNQSLQWSLASAGVKAIGIDKLNSIAKTIGKAVKQKLGLGLVVCKDSEELGNKLREAGVKINEIPQGAEGCVSRGNVYLVADNIQEGNRVYTVLAHEIAGHVGAEKIYPQFKSLMEQLLKLENSDEKIKAIFDDVRSTYKDLDETSTASEVFAKVMEQVYENENSFTGKIKNLVNFFIKKVKDFFREKLGIKLDVSTRELYGIARDILAKSTVKSILQGKVARQKIYDKSNVYEEMPVFAKVKDKSLLDKLNNEPTIKAYRAMQLIDGKLYPPMAAYVDGKLVEPTKLDEWYQADEHPELLLVKVGEKYIPIEKYLKENNNVMPDDNKLFFKLGKGKDDSGKNGFIQARYNPYWHASLSPLNDQFKAAWNRSNMVVVEVEIPKSELISAYKAKYAKDSVGETEWKSGTVSGQLAKLGKPRKVILSRYNKVVRIIPDSEIATRISEQLKGTDIKIPVNTVTPSLKKELEKRGVEFTEPEKGAPKQTIASSNRGKLYSVEYLIAETAAKLVKWGYQKLESGARFMAKYMKNLYEALKKNYGKVDFKQWANYLNSATLNGVKGKDISEEHKKEIFADFEGNNNPDPDKEFDDYLEKREAIEKETQFKNSREVDFYQKGYKEGSEKASKELEQKKEQAKVASQLAKLAKNSEKGRQYLEQQKRINKAIEEARKPKPTTIAQKFENIENWLAQQFADRRNRLANFQKDIENATGEKLADYKNPYRQLDTIDGRIQQKIENFNDEYFKPLYDFLVKNGINYEDFNKFTYAMHAQERDDYINEINPNFKANNERGSGWKDSEMGGTVDEVKKSLFEKYGKDKLMEAGKMFWKMNNAVIDLQEKYGLIDGKTADDIKNRYKYYTPLKHIADEDVITKVVERALGRTSKATDNLMFATAAIDTTIRWGEKNNAKLAMLNLASLYKTPLVEINRQRLEQYFNPKTGEVEVRLEHELPPNTITARIKGLNYRITFNDEDLYKAFISDNVGNNALFKAVVTISRTFNSMMGFVSTVANPDFGIANFIRDQQQSGLENNVFRGGKFATNALSNAFNGMKTYVEYRLGKDNADTRLYKEFIENGGMTGYADMMKLEDRAKNLEKKIDEDIDASRSLTGKVKKLAKHPSNIIHGLFWLFEEFNNSLEAATRFGVYKEKRKTSTALEAAELSKNITINFNRHGELWNSDANAIYLFSNASIQGTRKAWQTIKQASKTAKGRALMGSLVMAGFAAEILGNLLAGFDPDDKESYYEKLEEWKKDGNIILFTGGKEYISIPLSPVIAAPYMAGRNLACWTLGKKTMTQAFGDMFSNFVTTLNPLGEDNRTLGSLVPTFFRPMIELWTNKKWYGGPIRPEQPQRGAKKPEHKLFFEKKTAGVFVSFAKLLSDITDGDEYRGGYLDFSPSDMQYLYEHYSGGLGKSIYRGYKTITGQKESLDDIPMARRFYGETNDYGTAKLYKDNQQISNLFSKIKNERNFEYLKDKPEYRKIHNIISLSDKKIEQIRERRNMSEEEKEAAVTKIQKMANAAIKKIK